MDGGDVRCAIAPASKRIGDRGRTVVDAVVEAAVGQRPRRGHHARERAEGAGAEGVAGLRVIGVAQQAIDIRRGVARIAAAAGSVRPQGVQRDHHHIGLSGPHWTSLGARKSYDTYMTDRVTRD